MAAQGTVDQHPPVIWYRTVRNLTHQTNDTAQLFLGTRINCAQCHHHPYEKWSQDDYYQLQAFFARMGRKSGEIAQEPAIFVRPDGAVRNPTSGKIMQPRGLDGPELTIERGRGPAAEAGGLDGGAGQPVLRPGLCNRLWGHFMGRGLVEPVDDMRVTNPPSNPELLDALAKDFIAAQVRPEAPDPHHHGLDDLSAVVRADAGRTSTTSRTTPAPTRAGCWPR